MIFRRLFLMILFIACSLFSTTAQTWIPKATMPGGNGLGGPISFSINGKLYVGGGWNGTTVINTFYEYNPTTDTWTQKANLPVAICSSCCFALNGKGYVVCGAVLSLTNSVYQYDPVADTWQTKNNFPGTARQNTIGFSHNGLGYLFGGFIGSSTVLADMWQYNDVLDAWTQKATLAGNGRNNPVFSIINSQIFVGLGGSVGATSTYNDFYNYDPIADNYTAVANCPINVGGCASFSIDTIGFIGLGFTSGAIPSNTFYKFNPSSNSWTQTNNFGRQGSYNLYCEVVNGLPYIGCGNLANGSFAIDNWTWDKACNLEVHLGNDKTICTGTQLTLIDTNTLATHLWSTGETSASISISAAGSYWVKVTQGSCVKADTILILISPLPSIQLGKDTNICIPNTILLGTPKSHVNYTWQDGSHFATYLASVSGKYWVRVDSNGCQNSDTIQISSVDLTALNLGKDAIFCKGQNILLQSQFASATQYWSTGAIGSSILVEDTGNYWILIDSNGCQQRDTIHLLFDQTKALIHLGEDTVVCAPTTLQLDASCYGCSYNWSTGSKQASISVTATGDYAVTVNTSCSQAMAHKQIQVESCDCPIAIPTAFSPNGDGKNDSFGVVTYCLIEQFRMQIFNRWGELVFTTNKVEEKWDGFFKGVRQPIEIYIYSIQYTNPKNHLQTIRTGNLTLIL